MKHRGARQRRRRNYGTSNTKVGRAFRLMEKEPPHPSHDNPQLPPFGGPKRKQEQLPRRKKKTVKPVSHPFKRVYGRDGATG